MAGCCNDHHCQETRPLDSPSWRRALWIALAVNAGMFLAEIVAGVAAGSASLQADALDFLGDAANYAISLWRGRHGARLARPCRAPQGSEPWPARRVGARTSRLARLGRHPAAGRM